MLLTAVMLASIVADPKLDEVILDGFGGGAYYGALVSIHIANVKRVARMARARSDVENSGVVHDGVVPTNPFSGSDLPSRVWTNGRSVQIGAGS